MSDSATITSTASIDTVNPHAAYKIMVGPRTDRSLCSRCRLEVCHQRSRALCVLNIVLL